jgi:hypothetical protein
MKRLTVISAVHYFLTVAIIGVWFSVLGFATYAAADWTPMVTSSTFSGVQSDLGTAAVGILACCAIIMGIGLLIRAIAR